MNTQSSSAQNRTLQVWLQKIEQGEIKLPRFQRHEAWDYKRICSLLDAIIKNLPLGITLIHQVGTKELFISKFLSTAPQASPNGVNEHLLDGQQRLTSVYRSLYNNYDNHTYFLYLPEFDITDDSYDSDEETVYCIGRYQKKDNDQKYPLWANDNEKCLKRGFVPMHLMRPSCGESEIEEWIVSGTQYLKEGEDISQYYDGQIKLRNQINKIRERIKYYNLPHLTLPVETPKAVALRVFINMNTNSKPLKPYDVIVAEVESASGMSLHDMQDELNGEIPGLSDFDDLGYLILATSAMLQDKRPDSRGMLSMDFHLMVSNWSKLKKGLKEFLSFVTSQRVTHKKLMPSNVVIAPIAAILSHDFKHNDDKGVMITLLKKYMWSAFLSDRYESSPITKLMQDYKVLKKIVIEAKKDDGASYTEEDIPALNRLVHPIITADEYLHAGWPNRDNMKSKAIICITSMLGARDWSTDETLSKDNMHKREYHHIFPKAYLAKADINPDSVLNAALITATTNRNLGAESPFSYIMKKFNVHSENNMSNRLRTHLISPASIHQGSLKEENQETIRLHYTAFLNDRAQLAEKAVDLLCNGETLTIENLFGGHSGVVVEFKEMDEDITKIEDTIRTLMIDTISKNVEYQSLSEVIPSHIVERSKSKFKGRQKKLASTGNEEFDLSQAVKYMTLGEYQDAIYSPVNWKHFEPFFESKGVLGMRMTQLGTCRNIIRHGNTPTPVEKSDGEAAIHWFKTALKIG